jgi:regulator of sigma E protease
MSFVWMVGAFALILTPIILVHEFGHFVAARLSGIRVEEFGFGFPPRLAKLFVWKGTTFSLNAIPVGGFVRPAGEDDPSVPGGLASASKRARLFTLAAGAGANFIFALLILWVAYMVGAPGQVLDQMVRLDLSGTQQEMSIGGIRENSPGMEAGLSVGDVIREVNGQPVTNSDMLLDTMLANAGRPVELLIEREGEPMMIELTPRREGEYDSATEGPIGIALTTRVPLGVGQAAVAAAATVNNVILTTLRAPVMLIRGELSPQEARPLSFVGISQIAGREAQSGDLFRILYLAGIINVALGFTNLLPLPALDGGRILFVLVEAVRGRRVEPEREGIVHLVGMILLLGLMLILIIQDIVNPVIPF